MAIVCTGTFVLVLAIATPALVMWPLPINYPNIGLN